MAEGEGIRLIALGGHARSPSFTRAALELMVDGAKGAGAQVSILDLEQDRLPLFFEDEEASAPVEQFRAAIQDTDGLLVATPVYHDSYSGVLKGALDLLHTELSEKHVALAAVAGGRWGSGQALEHLRAVFREMGAWVLPRQVVITRSSEAFDAEGRPVDPEMGERLRAVGAELARHCARAASASPAPAAARAR